MTISSASSCANTPLLSWKLKHHFNDQRRHRGLAKDLDLIAEVFNALLSMEKTSRDCRQVSELFVFFRAKTFKNFEKVSEHIQISYLQNNKLFAFLRLYFSRLELEHLLKVNF
jgi:hypothetical protein